MRRVIQAIVGWIWPVWLVRGLGVLLLLAGLLGPWAYQWQRARRHRPEPPEAVAVRPAMVVVPVGSFQREGWEVKLTERFAISETEVTQENYQRVMGKNESRFKGDDLPVERVSWLEAVRYCNRLSEMEGRRACYDVNEKEEVAWRRGCPGYRLPTEAEWEYAARADQNTKYAGSNNLDEVGWYDKNAEGKTHPVAAKKSNAWGLYDMSGNVWEWVWDWYDRYPAGPAKDPTGPEKGQDRVARGGSWFTGAENARVADRYIDPPGNRYLDVGFRVARSLILPDSDRK